MPIYKPSELREFLESIGVSPKKSLSQNFLIDGNIIRKIVAVSDIDKDKDVILEIGPGPGALTEALLESKAKVIAIEKDYALARALERLNSEDDRLQVFQDDIMDFSFDRITHNNKLKVIANLPYHLTTPILSHLLVQHDRFSRVVVMVQEEVARRFTAVPGTESYSSYSIFLQFHAVPKYAFFVSKNCFYPAPKVDSAVVVFDLHQPPKVSNEERFFQLTRTAFQQRRKMLRGTLQKIYDREKITAALEFIGKNDKTRPEELSLQEFIQLFEILEA